MNLFDKLIEVSDSSTSLERFLNTNMQVVNDFNNSNFQETCRYIESAEKFILFKNQIVEELDYSKSYNKAFISILFDYYERNGCSSALQIINNVLETNDIVIGHRLNAAYLYLFNIDSASTLIKRYESICDNLQIAIECEEDNDKKAIATFLNYYSSVLRNVHPRYLQELRRQVDKSLEVCQYQFLENPSIKELLSIDCEDLEVAFSHIQLLIDKILGKSITELPIYKTKEKTFFIESDLSYSNVISRTNKSFESIRKISVDKVNKMTNRDEVYYSLGRGVTVLQEESQLYAYMNSYGSAHYAKMLSSLEKIPFDHIKGTVEIIDWGCGQAIATMVYLEYLQNKHISINSYSVTLIDPSLICLKRAALHTKHFNNSIEINTVWKDIDAVEAEDLPSNRDTTKIHLFSNILDVDEFSILNLIGLIESSQTGTNYFVCVSPFITDSKADRVDSFKRHFESKYNTYKLLGTEDNGGRLSDKYWSCNHYYKNKSYPCNRDKHSKNGCCNKWTRIIRVFKVDLVGRKNINWHDSEDEITRLLTGNISGLNAKN